MYQAVPEVNMLNPTKLSLVSRERASLTVMTLASCITDFCDPAKRHRTLRINEIKANTLDSVFNVKSMMIIFNLVTVFFGGM